MKGNTKLQTILNHKNMSQKDLYNLIKENSKEPVAEYQINRICKGVVTNYHIKTLIKICEALKVTPNEILTKSDYDNLFKS